MASKSKLQKYIMIEEKEIADAEKILEVRRTNLKAMKQVENGDEEPAT